jgi:hypothetical protein
LPSRWSGSCWASGTSDSTAVRTEIEELESGLDESEPIAKTLPHRERYLALNASLSRRILGAFSDWLDEVERELS